MAWLAGCSDARFEPLPTYEDTSFGDAASKPGADAHADAGSEPSGPCAPENPSAIDVPALEGDGWVIKLESTKPSLYEGQVRAHEFYANQPPLIADILVCNGDYENPNIKVGLSNHHYTWSYDDPKDAPQQGYIVNVHAVPTSDAIDGAIHGGVGDGSRVRVWGFEVDRIDYPGGAYWTDSGCNTLLITNFCVD